MQWLARPGQFPVFRQLLSMLKSLLEDQRDDPFGQMAFDKSEICDRKNAGLCSILGVEVRWLVFFVIHCDDDAKESADFWHTGQLLQGTWSSSYPL